MKYIIALLTLFLFISCDSLPKNLIERGKNTEERVSAAKKIIETEKNNFAAFMASSDFAVLKKYNDRERWEENFAKATETLNYLEKLRKDKIEQILDRNESKESQALLKELERFDSTMEESLLLAKKPGGRASFLKDVKTNIDNYYKKGTEALPVIKELPGALFPVVEEAKTNFSQKKDDLTSRFSVMMKYSEESEKAFAIVEKERLSGSPDLAVFGDSITAILQNKINGEKYDAELRKKIKELSKSYSKILTDMKVDYLVTVGRTSWNEASDWPIEHEYKYPAVFVSLQSAETLMALGEENEIAYLSGSIGIRIDRQVWDELSIDPHKSWPSSSDDNASFWIADMDAKYYHKYTIEENGQTSISEWQEVDEDFFVLHEKNLGMTILSKPFGFYEEEAQKNATPPGMAYVGNSKYGNWQNDASGRSFWVWYGQYRFFGDLIFGRPWYRNDWDHWNTNYRGRSNYYGHSDSSGRFGTDSGYTKQKYGGSSWGQSGGFKIQKPSIRRAGGFFRGRGPGGGGK